MAHLFIYKHARRDFTIFLSRVIGLRYRALRNAAPLEGTYFAKEELRTLGAVLKLFIVTS